MHYVKHGLRILLAICASGLAACLIILLMLGHNGSDTFIEIFTEWLGMSAFIAALASPALLIAIIWSEIRAVQSWSFFCIWSVLAAIIWLLILSGGDIMGQIEKDGIAFILGTLLSGFLGGLAYWGVAGRYAGNWKSQ